MPYLVCAAVCQRPRWFLHCVHHLTFTCATRATPHYTPPPPFLPLCSLTLPVFATVPLPLYFTLPPALGFCLLFCSARSTCLHACALVCGGIYYNVTLLPHLPAAYTAAYRATPRPFHPPTFGSSPYLLHTTTPTTTFFTTTCLPGSPFIYFYLLMPFTPLLPLLLGFWDWLLHWLFPGTGSPALLHL